MFTLEKVSVLSGASSLVAQGERFQGDQIQLFKHDDHKDVKDIKSVTDLEVGYQIMLWDEGTFSLRTSKITQIVGTDLEDSMVFWTETSLYRLREV